MPLAVTHVLLTIIVVDLFRDYVLKKKYKKYFTLHTILIAGIAGLLPDIDVPINMILNFFGYFPDLVLHGGLTHTPIFGLIFLIPGYIFMKQKKFKQAGYFFVLCFGVLFHIFLDFLLGGGMHSGIMIFWPLSTETFKIHLLLNLGFSDIPAALDALILLGWLWHEEAKHKIRDFI